MELFNVVDTHVSMTFDVNADNSFCETSTKCAYKIAVDGYTYNGKPVVIKAIKVDKVTCNINDPDYNLTSNFSCGVFESFDSSEPLSDDVVLSRTDNITALSAIDGITVKSLIEEVNTYEKEVLDSAKVIMSYDEFKETVKTSIRMSAFSEGIRESIEDLISESKIREKYLEILADYKKHLEEGQVYIGKITTIDQLKQLATDFAKDNADEIGFLVENGLYNLKTTTTTEDIRNFANDFNF